MSIHNTGSNIPSGLPDNIIISFETVGLPFLNGIRDLLASVAVVNEVSTKQIFDESLRQMFDCMSGSNQFQYLQKIQQYPQYERFLEVRHFQGNEAFFQALRNLFLMAATGLMFVLNQYQVFAVGKDFYLDHPDPRFLVIAFCQPENFYQG